MTQETLPDLHVIVLNDYCYVQGGASRVAIDEAVGLATAGVNVTFVGAVGPVCDDLKNAALNVVNLNQGELSSFRANPGVALESLWNRAAYQAVRVVLEAMDRRKTIVHVHGYTKSLSSSPIRFATGNGFEVVCTLHDFFSACPNGAFFNFVESKPCHLRGLSMSCISTNCDKRHFTHKLYRVARSFAQRHIGKFPSQVNQYIALSNKSMELLRPYLSSKARVRVLANPIDVGQSRPVNVARNKKVIAIGRLDTEKGTAILVDAARRTKSQLTLIGDGPWRPYAEEYEGCNVTGWLSRPEVMAELEEARCLVFPSLWYETYGLVVEEAAARGVPSIVSDISAAAERVMESVTGWRARAGDTNDLVRCLDIIKDDAVVERVGLAAFHRYWVNPPTPALHTATLINVYRDILANRIL